MSYDWDIGKTKFPCNDELPPNSTCQQRLDRNLQWVDFVADCNQVPQELVECKQLDLFSLSDEPQIPRQLSLTLSNVARLLEELP